MSKIFIRILIRIYRILSIFAKSRSQAKLRLSAKELTECLKLLDDDRYYFDEVKTPDGSIKKLTKK